MSFLADCVSKVAAENELLIFADGWMTPLMRKHRCRLTQALLPLEHPIADASRDDLDVLLDNEPIKSVVAALGVGIQFDLEDDIGFSLLHLRYGKVIVVTDTGSESEELKSKLLCFLSLFMRPIVVERHVYSLIVSEVGSEQDASFMEQVLLQEARQLTQVLPLV